MSKTLTTIKQHLTSLRDMYVVPTQATNTRAEIRRIVETFSFSSAVPDLNYEDLESATDLIA